jgi:hypothetical protein
LVALSLGSAFGAGELIARATYGSPRPELRPLLEVRAHATRGWEMIPAQTHYTYDHEVRVNSLGLRGPEPAPPQPGERRVLLVGDSLIYGQGVAEEQTVSAHLARLGEATGEAWSVFNGGLRAYATHQELALLADLGPELAPTDVVLCWYWNDFDERDLERTYEKLEGSGPIAFDLGEAPRGAALWKWRGMQVLRKSALVMHLYDRWREARRQPKDDAYYDAGFERLAGYLPEFVELCEQLDASFRVALFPHPAGLGRPDAPSSVIEARALELFEERGLAVTDLRPALLEHGREHGSVPTIPFDGHYEGPANGALARALFEALSKPVD